MNFHMYGNKENPSIMLIHGGGNAWWNYLRQAQFLAQKYYVILPTLDGHGEEHAKSYISTEDSAAKLIQYIDQNCNGHLLLLCGVSLGGQIVIEMLSSRHNIAEKAIIDGSICYPQPRMAKLCITTMRIFGSILFCKNSCKLQISMLNRLPKMRFSKDISNYYIQDMPLLRKDTLYAIYRTYMAKYKLKESIHNTTAQVMYWYGSKEMNCVKKSASLFRQAVPSCQIYEAIGYNHGYLAIYLPDEWIEIVNSFLDK